MFELWNEELTEEETERLIDKAAGEIHRRGLDTPAILVLEMHRPLSFLAANGAVMLSPFLIPFFGHDGVNDYSRLFSKPDNVAKLMDRLDRLRMAKTEAE